MVLMGLPAVGALATLRSPSVQKFGVTNRPMPWSSGHLRPAVSTKLRYSDGIEESAGAEQTQTLPTARIGTWWSNVFAPKSEKTDDSQQVVDEYLEFLDRRYHRLHDEETEVKQANKKFSVLGWLKETQKQDAVTDPCEDALYVLGVAEMASQKLLQKHRSLPQKSGVVIETKATRVKRNGAHLSILNRMNNVKFQAKGLASLRVYKPLKVLLSSMSALVRRGPVKTMVALWNFGGGKDTIALGVSVLTIAFFLLRPLLEAINRSTV